MATAEKKKMCEQCHNEKDVDLFRKVTNQYTGVHPMSICKDCYNSNNEVRKRKQEEEWQRNAEGRKQRLTSQRQREEWEAGRAARVQEIERRRQPLTEGNPTEVRDHAWIYAFRKQGSYPEPTERNGKWLIFLSPEVINRYWQKIKTAVEQGQLGAQAKVSTLSKGSMPPEVRRKKEERGDTSFVICVYTYDYQDKEDVMRIRQVLHDLGIQWRIRYKADEDTSAGNYGGSYRPIYEEGEDTMARQTKQDVWQQEQTKLKVHGFKWRFAGVVEGKKQWQLYTPEGEPISKTDAFARIEQEKEWKEAEEWARIESSIYEFSWDGYFSEEVEMCGEIVAMHQEGESYVIFPSTVQITKEGDITRYTLPSGKVFIMRDTILFAEGEEGY